MACLRMPRPCGVRLAAAAALLLLAAAGQQAAAQFGGGMPPGMGGMGGMGGGEPPKAMAVKSDIPFIRCQVCEALVKQAYRHTKAERAALKPGQKLSESAIIDYLENMCDPDKKEGAWVSHYDMVEKGQEIKLVDTGKPSRCNTECATIARACAQAADALDLSDLSEALFNGISRSKLTSQACYESSSLCRDKPPPVPKGRKPGPRHEPMSEQELQHQQLMASMKAAGLSGQMFSRDDVQRQLADLEGGGEGGDGDASTAGSGAAAALAKAQETVSEVVGQAKDAAAAVVDRAGGFLKDQLGRISSSLKAGGAGGSEL